MIEKRTFEQGLNTDDNDFVIKPGQYRNAINMRILTSADGKTGGIENVRGNQAVGDATALGSGTNIVIGTYEDEKNGRTYDFVYNSEGHHVIKQYDKESDTTTILLNNDSFDKTGVNVGLNFTRSGFITGVAMVGDTLFWTDPIPRCVNVKRLLQGKITQFNDDAISLIKRPPNLPPYWTKTTVGTQTSMINDNAFEFMWRFTYYDGQYTVFSQYSTLADYGNETDTTNAIAVGLPSDNLVPEDVRFVELAVRFGNTGNIFIVKRWDKEDPGDAALITNHNAGADLTYNFFNDVVGEAVAESDGSKLSEAVPLTSKALDAADNRVFLGNNVMGYDTPHSADIQLAKTTTTINVNGQQIIGTWYIYIRSYHQGLTNVHHYYAWVLNLFGYDGIKPGFYAVDGVEGSEHPIYVADDLNFDFSYPEFVNYNDMHYAGLTAAEVRNYYNDASNGTLKLNASTHNPSTSIVAGAPTQTVFKPQRIFKTADTYQVGLVFYDKYLRSSFVVIGDGSKISTGDTSYDNTTYVDKIVWTLSNANALAEIPAWACYVGIAMTKSLRTRYFLQTFPYEVSYVNKGDDDNYETKKENYDPTFAGIQIDITSLSKDGLGYVFNKGDVCKLYYEVSDTKKELNLNITDQYGKYVVCNLVDIGDLTQTLPCLIEIYTPYKAQAIEPFWEIGQVFPISNPGTDTRQYSVLTGTILGDSWIVARKFSAVLDNGVEAMSPNDKYFQNWWTDAGRPNTTAQPGLGQATKESNIVFSNQYIPQTLINGLSSFDSANTKDLPDGCGPIRKLVYTAKTQGDLGAVMVALCENETVSIYIGEVSVQQQTGDAFIAASPQVMGTVNVLKGSYGTINPESVVEKNGNVYFLDRKHGKVVRYAVNGLFPISDYKMKAFFHNRCKAMNALTSADMTSLGVDGLYCYGGFDDFNAEYLLFMPRVKILPDMLEDIIRATYEFSLNFVTATTMTTQASILSGFKFYSGVISTTASGGNITVKYGDQVLLDNVVNNGAEIIIPTFKPPVPGQTFTVTAPQGTVSLTINELQPNYHVFDDGQSGVLAFKEGYDKWVGRYMYEPEYFGSIGASLYGFKAGKCYAHGDGPYGTFFGQWFPPLVAMISNDNAGAPRIFNGTILTASECPAYTHLRTEVPWKQGIYHQSTDLIEDDYSPEEGKFYGPFFFDRLSPNAAGTPEQRMRNGDVMRAQIGHIFYEFDGSDAVNLVMAEINYRPSSGHIV